MNSLESLIEQIKKLPKTPETLSQRIALCRQALAQVNRESRPILWAQLHVELGLHLHQMSNGDRAQRLEEAIEHFQEAFTVYTRQDHAEVWAAMMHNLATVYSERIRGDRVDNLKQAIRLYNQALEVRTRDAFPEDWASTQHNLANVYAQRIKGNRAENLEQAITLYCNALSVWTRERYPSGWARAQKGLGTAYFLRVRGGQSDNLRMAIACFEEALTIWTRQAYPLGWAEIQDGLGLAWRDYAGDDPSANVEQAIACHQAALEVWTRENHPWEWARAQHNLGTAWRSRLQGNRTENLEEAIRCYQQALGVRKREAHPEAWAETTHSLATAYSERFTAKSLEEAIKLYEQVLKVRTRQALPLAWARTQSELGNVYIHRIQGERAANLEWAIEHYMQALEIQSPETCPQDWATTQQNLAVACSERLVEDRADNLKKAIEHYEQALRVFDRQSLMQWATVQTDLADTYWKLGNLEQSAHYLNQAVTLCLEVVDALDPLPPSPRWALAHYNLGNAYGDFSRIRGDYGENQERAIEHYTEALKFYTPQAFSERWANTHNNLGVTYWERQEGNRAENLLQAIHHFNRALEFFTPGTFPADARRAARNLGNLHFGERNWVEAHAAYDIALQAAEILYQASFMETGRDVEIGENAALHVHDAFCLAHLGQIEKALVRLEEGKTRTLAERLGRDAVQLEKAKPEDQKRYRELINRVKALEAEQRAGGEGRPYTEIARDVEQTRKELGTLTQRIHGYLPDFLPAPLDFAAIQALVPDERTALAEFCVTEKGSVVLVIRPEEEPVPVWIKGFTQTDLSRTVHNWVAAYLSRDHTRWRATIERVLKETGLRLVTPLHTVLQKYGITRLILIPQSSLFLLPLHAAWIAKDGACLLDRYEVSYVPSATVLQRCQERAIHAQTQGLFAIANPTGDIAYAGSELQVLESLFEEHKIILWGKDATKETTLTQVSGHGYVHFSCHGQYDWDEPSRSALLLAGSLMQDEEGRQIVNYEHMLTLTEVEAKLDLAQTYLITLSACETGLSEAIGPRAEEYVGLPAGFLLAGAPAVLASLWGVYEISTTLLMERFYLNHRGEPDEKPDPKLPLLSAEALRQAQIWLRDEVTAQEAARRCKAQIEKLRSRGELVPPWLSRDYREYAQMARKTPDSRPFAHPFYWAAFALSGVTDDPDRLKGENSYA